MYLFVKVHNHNKLIYWFYRDKYLKIKDCGDNQLVRIHLCLDGKRFNVKYEATVSISSLKPPLYSILEYNQLSNEEKIMVRNCKEYPKVMKYYKYKNFTSTVNKIINKVRDFNILIKDL